MRQLRLVPRQAVPVFLLLAGLISGCAATAPTLKLESEPTSEGLLEVSGIKADQAWARPGVDMSQYSKIIIRDIDVGFRPGGETQANRLARTSGGPFEVSAEQQQIFREIAQEEVLEELGRSSRFTIVDEADSDVLLVAIEIADLVSYIAPDVPLSKVYLSEFGEATVVAELRDSVTGTVLAQIADRRIAERIDRSVQMTPRVSNTAQVRELFELLARPLRQQLDELGDLGSQ